MIRGEVMEYVSNGVVQLRTLHQHSILDHSAIGLTDKSPMREKWPVNKQPAADQILHGDWSPIPAVEAVITVIAHGEITLARHRVRLIRFREILVAGRITAVRRSSGHHPFEAVALSLFT